MARPVAIQKLEKGKLLTGTNFPQFVDSWNYVAERIENLKGDRDANPQGGRITIDSSDPEHPIIRYVGKDAVGELSGGVTSIVGEYDSIAISGDVQAMGAEGSGLMVTTDEDDEGGYLEIDVADREEDEEYGGREITVNDEPIAKVFGTTDFEIAQKQIEAGTGIIVEEAGDVITISRTSDGSLSAGAGITIENGTVAANADGVSIETRSASSQGDQKIQLLGFDVISNYKTESSIGNDMAAEYETGDLAVVASPVGNGYALRYKPMGLLPLEADEDTGLTVTKEQTGDDNAMKLDLKDRDGSAFGVHDYRQGSDTEGVKIFSSGDIDALDVQAGSGVSVTKQGNVATVALALSCLTDVQSASKELTCEKNGTVVTITYTGEEPEEDTEGYTGTETVVTGVTYDTSSHQLTKFYKTFTFSNGLLADVSDEQSTVIETAEKETV